MVEERKKETMEGGKKDKADKQKHKERMREGERNKENEESNY